MKQHLSPGAEKGKSVRRATGFYEKNILLLYLEVMAVPGGSASRGGVD